MTVTFTFSAVFLEAVETILRVHGHRLSSHLLVDVELLLQSADEHRQVLLSHLHDTNTDDLTNTDLLSGEHLSSAINRLADADV